MTAAKITLVLKLEVFTDTGSQLSHDWQHIESADLTAGVIDDAARKAFSRGWCFELAVALSLQTGRPVAAVAGRRDGGPCRHYGLVVDEGHVLDVCGVHALGDWAAIWGASEIRTVPSGKLVDSYPGLDDAMRLCHARSFVPALLELAGLSDRPRPSSQPMPTWRASGARSTVGRTGRRV